MSIVDNKCSFWTIIVHELNFCRSVPKSEGMDRPSLLLQKKNRLKIKGFDILRFQSVYGKVSKS